MDVQTVAVMGGAGRVGLPLAIGLAEAGYHVIIHDVNTETMDLIQSGEMPFEEDQAGPVLARVIAEGKLTCTSDPSSLTKAEAIFCAIGTPVDEFMNPTTHRFIAQIEAIREHLRDGQVLLLRSTMFPGTSEHLQRLFQEHGPRVEVGCCPERVTQGKAYVEMRSLPQVISGFSERARRVARSIFERLGAEVIELDPLEAELVKLFNNAWRYTSFAIANQFYMIANDYGIDFYRLHNAMTHKYPRGAGMPTAGFAAGPCLFKDTVQLVSFANKQLPLGHASVLVNEGLPLYIVERLARDHDLASMSVGILGLAFKGDCDDLRDSLAFKLRKVLILRCKRIVCSDVRVPRESILNATTQIRPSDLVSTEDLIEQCDLIVIGAPHADYRSIDFKGKKVVDIWNLRGEGGLI